MLGISSLLADVIWSTASIEHYKDKAKADAVQQLADDEKAGPLKETFQRDASRAQKVAVDSQVGSIVAALVGAGCIGVAHYATGTKFALETADILVAAAFINTLIRRRQAYHQAFHDTLIPPREDIAQNHSALIARARRSKEDASRLRILQRLVFVAGLAAAGTYHYYNSSSDKKTETKEESTAPTISAPTSSANISVPNPQIFPTSEVQAASDRLTEYCSKSAKTETALMSCLNASLPNVERVNGLCPSGSSPIPPYNTKNAACYLSRSKADEAVCERFSKSSICARR